jgi:hypothetical protein
MRWSAFERQIRRGSCSALAFLILSLTASPGFAAKMLYWQSAAGSNRTVSRSGLDGSNAEVILTSDDDAGGNGINYISHSPARQRLYFTTADPHPGLYSADYDGSNVQLMQSFPYASFPRGIDVNDVTDRLYWPSNHGLQSATNSKISSLSLDNLGSSHVSSLSDGSYPYGMVVDEVYGKLYWSELGFHRIVRSNLDGSSPEVILTGVEAFSLALDPANGKLYWPDNAAHTLRVANTNGSGVQSIGPLHGLSLDSAVTLDLQAGQVYWSDTVDYTIYRANLDGSNRITVRDNAVYVQSLMVVDVNAVPEPSSVALLAVGSLGLLWRIRRGTSKLER